MSFEAVQNIEPKDRNIFSKWSPGIVVIVNTVKQLHGTKLL